MGRTIIVGLVMLGLAVGVGIGWAQQETTDQLPPELAPGVALPESPQEFVEIITGELVDITDYLVMGTRVIGATEKASLEQAITAGLPVGILEEDTELLYVLVAKDRAPLRDLVLPYVGQTISVTGRVYEGDGVTILIAEKIDKAL